MDINDLSKITAKDGKYLYTETIEKKKLEQILDDARFNIECLQQEKAKKAAEYDDRIAEWTKKAADLEKLING